MSHDQAVAPTGSSSQSRRYDAFISYSQRDVVLARRFQALLSRLAKPWYRRRGLRIFRDETNLSAGPRLWDPIVAAMAASQCYVLVASPAAAASSWVERELAWWIDNRQAEDLIVLVAAGDIDWDETTAGFDTDRTTCLPPSGLCCFAEEPHWIDLRGAHEESDENHLLPYVASVMAAITGRDKDELIGEDLHQHRRVKRIAVSVAALLSVLAVLLGLVAFAAVQEKQRAQRNEATAILQQRIADAHTYAAESQTLLDGHLGQAILDARRAYAMRKDLVGRGAVLGALTHDPFLVDYIRAPKDIKAMAWAGASKRLVLGGEHYLMVADPRGHTVITTKANSRVTAVGSSPDGRLVAAGTQDGVVVLEQASGHASWRRVALPDRPISAVTVDPTDGRVYALAQDGRLAALDITTGRPVHSPVTIGSVKGSASYLELVGSSPTLVIGTNHGQAVARPAASPWNGADFGEPAKVSGRELRTYTSDRQHVTFSYVEDGSHGSTGTHDTDGNISSTRLFGSGRPPSYPKQSALASTSFALSDDGSLIATETHGVLNVNHPSSTAFSTQLPGAASVHASLTFSGDRSMLAAASGTTVGVWGTHQLSGDAQVLPTNTPNPHDLVHPSTVLADAANHAVVTLGPQPDMLACWHTVGPARPTSTQLDGDTHPTALAWAGNRRVILVGGTTRGGAAVVSTWTTQHGCPASMQSQRPLGTTDVPTTVRRLADGSTLVATAKGELVHLDAAGRSAPLPDPPLSSPVRSMAVSPDHDTVVLGLKDGTLRGYRVSNGALRPLPLVHTAAAHKSVIAVVYVDENTIAFARKSGTVFLKSLTSSEKPTVLHGALGFNLAVASGGDLLVGSEPGHSAAIWDISSPQLLVTFRFAPVSTTALEELANNGNDKPADTAMTGDGAGGVWFGVPSAYLTQWTLNPATLAAQACADVATLAAQAAATSGTPDPCDS